MKKVGLTLLFLLILASAILAVDVLIPVGPTVISFVALMKGEVESSIPIEVRFWKNFDQVNAELASEKFDIVVLPVSLGANLYMKGADLRLVGVTLWKAFYIVTKDVKINTIEDLRGMDIYTPQGKGQTADVLIRYLLNRHGMDAEKDVSIKYSSPQEIVALLAKGVVNVAILPEPFVTLSVQKSNASITLDLQQLWAEETGLPPRVPITGVFALGKSLQVIPLSICEAINGIKKSALYAMSNPEHSSHLAVDYLGGMDENILKESLQRTLYEYRSVFEVKDEVTKYFEVVSSVAPQAMPEVPDENFFAK